MKALYRKVMRELNKKIFAAYESVGKLSSFYDSMMTGSSLLGRLALKIFWGLSSEDHAKFLRQAFNGIPENFCGKLLEIPVGTGVLSMPIYKNFPDAEIICADYSTAMLKAAEICAKKNNLPNVRFIQSDVGKLEFEDNYFDLVLSIDGLHAFPDKSAAYNEIYRVIKSNGIFCGCMYVKGENRRTDIFVENFCNRVGVFTPPHETLKSLESRLKSFYKRVEISNVKSFAGFICTNNLITY